MFVNRLLFPHTPITHPLEMIIFASSQMLFFFWIPPLVDRDFRFIYMLFLFGMYTSKKNFPGNTCISREYHASVPVHAKKKTLHVLAMTPMTLPSDWSPPMGSTSDWSSPKKIGGDQSEVLPMGDQSEAALGRVNYLACSVLRSSMFCFVFFGVYTFTHISPPHDQSLAWVIIWRVQTSCHVHAKEKRHLHAKGNFVMDVKTISHASWKTKHVQNAPYYTRTCIRVRHDV